MKGLFKRILILMLLIAAGIFGIESYRSMHNVKSVPARTSNQHSAPSPLYNSSDARVPYAFPLK